MLPSIPVSPADYAQVLREYDDSGQTIVDYVYGNDLISQKRSSLKYYFHYAGQMSTRQITDDSAQITDTYTYDAFGVLLNRSGSTENNYMYTGEQYDLNVGFLIMIADLESNWHFGKKVHGKYLILCGGISLGFYITVLPHVSASLESPGLFGPNAKLLTGPVSHGSILSLPFGSAVEGFTMGIAKGGGFLQFQLGLDITAVSLMAGWSFGFSSKSDDDGPSPPDKDDVGDDIFVDN